LKLVDSRLIYQYLLIGIFFLILFKVIFKQFLKINFTYPDFFFFPFKLLIIMLFFNILLLYL